MNVPAIMSPYILAAIVWNITRDVEVNWRILLGFGAIPALLVWIPSIRVKDSEEFVRSKFGKSIFHALGDRSHWYSLLGMQTPPKPSVQHNRIQGQLPRAQKTMTINYIGYLSFILL
eukprot:GHVT01045257.1.p1 GENE.GHVT01045257.1~~GHVT01045257.1.p1  ORF type:complete len:117 (+),score=6.10 GHVT01045257.1:3-353(+)